MCGTQLGVRNHGRLSGTFPRDAQAISPNASRASEPALAARTINPHPLTVPGTGDLRRPHGPVGTRGECAEPEAQCYVGSVPGRGPGAERLPDQLF